MTKIKMNFNFKINIFKVFLNILKLKWIFKYYRCKKLYLYLNIYNIIKSVIPVKYSTL